MQVVITTKQTEPLPFTEEDAKRAIEEYINRNSGLLLFDTNYKRLRLKLCPFANDRFFDLLVGLHYLLKEEFFFHLSNDGAAYFHPRSLTDPDTFRRAYSKIQSVNWQDITVNVVP